MIHRHTWAAVSVTHPPNVHYPTTIVLYRCDACGATKTRKMKGRWQIEDLNAQ